MLRLHLRPFLERHRISAYQLARATQGRLSEATVYGMARKPLQRIDLDSVGTVIEALETLTGVNVSLSDLVEQTEPGINPKYAQLLKEAQPVPPGHLERTAERWSTGELAADEAYWKAYRAEQRQLQGKQKRRRK